MNETVMNASDIPQVSATRPSDSIRKSRRSFYGYTFLAVLTMLGWLIRDTGVVNPAFGIGYWLGIIGGSLMLIMLLYPVVKKLALSRNLGLARYWFHIHVIFGLVGPLLILYHCNFQVDAFNSKFALYCMLAVAISGLIGKHIYSRIHNGLFGHRASMQELRAELSQSIDNGHGLSVVMPKLVNEIQRLSDELQGDQITKSIDVRRSLAWAIKPVFVRIRLWGLIRRETGIRSQESPAIRQNVKSLRRTANAYAGQSVRLMRRVAQLSLYERMFSLWHLFHLPLFILLIISASFHVLAVHMY